MRKTIVTVLLSVMLGALVMFALSYITGGPERTPAGAVCSITEDGQLTDCSTGKPLNYNGKSNEWH